MSPSKEDTPKMAIKGFSLSASSKSSKAAPKQSLGKRPRSTFNNDSESDSDHGGRKRGREEAITGFGEGHDRERRKEREREPLVIPKLENKWRGARDVGVGKQSAVQAGSVEVTGDGVGREVVVGEKEEVKWGLNVPTRQKEDSPAPAPDGEGGNDNREVEVEKEEPPKERTADEEALAHLLGTETRKGADLVIPQTAISEDDAYKKAVAEAPDVSSLEDYERIPVEEFGAALLRGMGWNGKLNDKKEEKKKKRQNLLGLGATELPKGEAEELGAWVKTTKGGDKGCYKGKEKRVTPADYKRERDEKRARREGRGDDERERERDRDRDRGERRGYDDDRRGAERGHRDGDDRRDDRRRDDRRNGDERKHGYDRRRDTGRDRDRDRDRR